MAIHRETGDRAQLSLAFGNLALIHHRRGSRGDAAAAFDEGEALARSVGDPAALASLLAARGLHDLASGDPECARADLHEVERLAAELAAPADSPLGRRLAELREAVAAAGGD